MSHSIFVTGGTGYMGQRLIPFLASRGHKVTTVVRPGSDPPPQATAITADPLLHGSYTNAIPPADTFVHLIGTPHPSPAKATQFREVDLVSVQVAIEAACQANVRHFIYLSVAQPAPMMKAFLAVRSEGESLIRDSGIPATFLRPWYVLGPGHRWPYFLLPFYWFCERLPATREGAARLGLVNISQMTNALVWSVENPPNETRILDVPAIRERGKS
jgi:nucleoside-diphosphate-sugar epimerase